MIKQMFDQKAFIVFTCLMLAAYISAAQVEYSEEDSIPELLESQAEPDSINLPDTPSGNAQVAFDTAFNYNFMEGIAKDYQHFRAGLLYDLDKNTIVWQKDMNYSYPIASVTKIMTAMLAIGDIQNGTVNWNDKIDVASQRATYTGRGKHRKKNVLIYHNSYSFRDLLKMTLIESNNYAAMLVGKHCGGDDLDAFIKRMNARAVELKMTNTFYGNPSGLPGSFGEADNSSSPHDLLLLAKEALKYPELMEIASMGTANVENGHNTYSIRNHNGLVRDYVNEIDGIKTGFTRNAGFCLVASAKRYDHHLIAIGLGFNSVNMRNQFIADLLNNYYQKIGLGILGTTLNDSALQAVKPGYCSENYSYGTLAHKIPYSVKNEFSNNNDNNVIYKTVVHQKRKTHIVHIGETLAHIADKFDCSVADIRTWNKLKNTSVHKGQKLTLFVEEKKTIPVRVNAGVAAMMDSINKIKKIKPVTELAVAEKKQDTETSEKNYFIYIVQPGDTLWNIAQRYNLNSVDEIRRLNKITKNQIKIGQRVKVPRNS